MSSFLWHTISDMSANLTAIQDADSCDLYKASFDWNYQARHQSLTRDNSRFCKLWYSSTNLGGDPTSSPFMLGSEVFDIGGLWEAWMAVDSGSARGLFLKGQCKDSNGNPISSVRIEFFLTANDTYIGDCISDQNGFYSMPMPNGTGACYGVANYSNGVYVGATVNTLQAVI